MKNTKHGQHFWPAYVDYTNMVLSGLILLIFVIMLTISTMKKSDTEGLEQKAEYIITAEWDMTQEAPDVDLWGLGPSDPKTPVFYRDSNRRVGLMFLDVDCMQSTNMIMVNGVYNYSPVCREIMTVKGKVPGKYTFALALFNYIRGKKEASEPHLGVKVHVVVYKVEPSITVMYEKDLVLDRVKERYNFFSFRLDGEGNPTVVPVPDEPIQNLIDGGKETI